MWYLGKDGALSNGITVLIKDTPESSHPFHFETAKLPVYEPGSKLSPDAKFSGALILDSQTLEVTQSMVFLLKQPVWIKTTTHSEWLPVIRGKKQSYFVPALPPWPLPGAYSI